MLHIAAAAADSDATLDSFPVRVSELAFLNLSGAGARQLLGEIDRSWALVAGEVLAAERGEGRSQVIVAGDAVLGHHHRDK